MSARRRSMSIDLEDHHPTLSYIEPVTGVDIEIAFGYVKGDRVAAVFRGDQLVLIPAAILQIAYEQGWPPSATRKREERRERRARTEHSV